MAREEQTFILRKIFTVALYNSLPFFPQVLAHLIIHPDPPSILFWPTDSDLSSCSFFGFKYQEEVNGHAHVQFYNKVVAMRKHVRVSINLSVFRLVKLETIFYLQNTWQRH